MEVWINIGLKKVNTHEEAAIKALLDNITISLFINKRFVEE